MRFLSDRATTLVDADGGRLNGWLFTIVTRGVRAPFRKKAERKAESLPSIASSHVRSTLPSRVAGTRGENAWVGTGKVISRTFAVVDA